MSRYDHWFWNSKFIGTVHQWVVDLDIWFWNKRYNRGIKN